MQGRQRKKAHLIPTMSIFLSCFEAARRISEQHDAPLNRSSRIRLRLHLTLCAHCRHLSHQIKLLRSFVHDYPEHLSRVKLPDRARARIILELSRLP
jgi:hypothetical protein